MNVVELYAGSGSVSYGLGMADFVTTHMVERDPVAVEHLTMNVCEDSAMLNCTVQEAAKYKRDMLHPALVWASPPCQPVSRIGLRSGSADERDGWGDTLDFLSAVMPTWFMAEQVVGQTQHSPGHGTPCPGCEFHEVLRRLKGMFRHVQWRILYCQRYGIPQVRKRLIVVAGPKPFQWPKWTHSKGGTVENTVPFVTMGQALDLKITDCITDSRYPWRGTQPWRLDRPSPAVMATEEKGSTYTQNNWERKLTTKHGCERASDALDLAGCGRRVTLAQARKLQQFPGHWRLFGTVQQQYRIIGNAVPWRLAQTLGRALWRSAL